jgi:hypothetical protein
LEQASRLGFNSPKDLLLYQKTTTRATFDFLVDIDKIKAEYGALGKEDPRGSLGLEKAWRTSSFLAQELARQAISEDPLLLGY